MPEDLAQQIPYIRRALEAYRIPILELAGFEADDVIGTLAHKAADATHCVYVVSSDKDMMQLVNDDVHILNPPKDNLICDAAKVEEILGVPPERVIDIMALRGDTIDNIPGAPGIGDKGSVEIIKRFGTVEQALDRADEVEKKTYRESLQNNRDTILFSKSMATIDTNVPVEFNVEAMRAGEPDVNLLRQLFTELEFTSLLKELLPEVQMAEAHYSEAQSAADVESILNSIAQEGAWPSRWNKQNRFLKAKKKSSKRSRSQECFRSPTNHPECQHPTPLPAALPSRERQAPPPSSNSTPAPQATSCVPS